VSWGTYPPPAARFRAATPDRLPIDQQHSGDTSQSRAIRAARVDFPLPVGRQSPGWILPGHAGKYRAAQACSLRQFRFPVRSVHIIARGRVRKSQIPEFNFAADFRRSAWHDGRIVDLGLRIENVVQPAHGSAASLKNVGHKSSATIGNIRRVMKV